MPETRPAFIHAKMVATIPDAPFPMPNHDTEEKGRIKTPAFLFTAHQAG